MKNTVICWDQANVMWLQEAYREGKKSKYIYDKSASRGSLYSSLNMVVKLPLAKETQRNGSFNNSLPF